jgi:RNA polymerase sigma-70 factor (ECF subfamily)
MRTFCTKAPERANAGGVSMDEPGDGAHADRSIIGQQLRADLLRGLDGDAAAYHRFLDGLSGHLRGFLRARLRRSSADVEDILQEALIAVHNARHTYREDQSLTAWVYAIARYKLMDFFRAHARRDALHDPLDSNDLFAVADLEPDQSRRDLHQLLRTLPERHRLPIELVKLQGLSVAEASALTGLSPSAIKIGIHRGLKALASRIRKYT